MLYDRKNRGWVGLFLEEKAEFAVGALGTEVVGEVEGRSGACGDGGKGQKSTKGEKAGGFVEAESGAELAGGGAEDAAAEGRVERAEAVELDGYGGLAGGGADGASAAADGLAGEENLGQQAV
jgi:hypothetical protein